MSDIITNDGQNNKKMKSRENIARDLIATKIQTCQKRLNENHEEKNLTKKNIPKKIPPCGLIDWVLCEPFSLV